MIIYIILFLNMSLMNLSWGADYKKSAPSLPPSEFQVSKEFCDKISITHRMQDNVRYRAGVDVDGQAVASADLNPVRIALPQKIRIPLTLQKRTRQAAPSAGELSLKSPYIDEIPFGFIEYELESGRITYNGKPLSSQREAFLRQKCLTILEN